MLLELELALGFELALGLAVGFELALGLAVGFELDSDFLTSFDLIPLSTELVLDLSTGVSSCCLIAD